MALELVPAPDTPSGGQDEPPDTAQDTGTLTPTDPALLLRGRFAFYETPSGGIHLVAKIDGQDTEIHQEVPKMALKMFGGRGKLSELFGGRDG